MPAKDAFKFKLKRKACKINVHKLGGIELFKELFKGISVNDYFGGGEGLPLAFYFPMVLYYYYYF